MLGRRYSLLIGRAYAKQNTFTPDIIPITPTVTEDTGGTTIVRQQYQSSEVKVPEIVTRARTEDEVAFIQDQYLGWFVETLGGYVNMYYSDPTKLEEDAGFLQFDNIEITDHHIEFDVDKIGGNATDGNVGEITVYNLSDADAAFLTSIGNQQNFAQLSAGYNDEGMKTLIRGNIKVVEDTLDGLERRTKIIITDGSNFVQNQMSVRTYRKGTRVNKIVNDLLTDIALPKGAIELPPDEDVIKKPLIVHGRSVEQLKRVLDARGYSVNIQDLYLNIYKRTLDLEVQQTLAEIDRLNAGPVDRTISIAVRSPAGYIHNVRVVSNDTGLLAAPTRISDTSGMSTQETENEPTAGIKFKHLLSGEFTPNAFVFLDTEEFYGNYRVLKVTHSGSLDGDRWETEVEAEKISWPSRDEQQTPEPQEKIEAPRDVRSFGFSGRSVEPPETTENTGAFGGFQR